MCIICIIHLYVCKYIHCSFRLAKLTQVCNFHGYSYLSPPPCTPLGLCSVLECAPLFKLVALIGRATDTLHPLTKHVVMRVSCHACQLSCVSVVMLVSCHVCQSCCVVCRCHLTYIHWPITHGHMSLLQIYPSTEINSLFALVSVLNFNPFISEANQAESVCVLKCLKEQCTVCVCVCALPCPSGHLLR